MTGSEPTPAPTDPAPPARPLPRRAVLAASGTAVLAVAAACSSGTTGSAATGSAASSTAPNPGATTSTTSTASAAASAESADPAPTGTPLATVADVRSAGAVVVQAPSGPLLLAYTDGTVVAHTAVCTHQQCTIAASGRCPCHGSRFNVGTGAVENGPALRPLAEESVTVSGGQVYPA